jgi:hypothetical protein
VGSPSLASPVAPDQVLQPTASSVRPYVTPAFGSG